MDSKRICSVEGCCNQTWDGGTYKHNLCNVHYGNGSVKNIPYQNMTREDLQAWWLERRRKAFRMREEGITLKAIGKVLNVSPHRAKMLIEKHEREISWGRISE